MPAATEISEFALTSPRRPDRAQEMIVTLSHQGYVQIAAASEYQVQHRGGRARPRRRPRRTITCRPVVANTHDWLLCFSSNGRLVLAARVRIAGRQLRSRGKPFVNLLPGRG